MATDQEQYTTWKDDSPVNSCYHDIMNTNEGEEKKIHTINVDTKDDREDESVSPDVLTPAALRLLDIARSPKPLLSTADPQSHNISTNLSEQQIVQQHEQVHENYNTLRNCLLTLKSRLPTATAATSKPNTDISIRQTRGREMERSKINEGIGKIQQIIEHCLQIDDTENIDPTLFSSFDTPCSHAPDSEWDEQHTTITNEYMREESSQRGAGIDGHRMTTSSKRKLAAMPSLLHSPTVRKISRLPQQQARSRLSNPRLPSQAPMVHSKRLLNKLLNAPPPPPPAVAATGSKPSRTEVDPSIYQYPAHISYVLMPLRYLLSHRQKKKMNDKLLNQTIRIPIRWCIQKQDYIKKMKPGLENIYVVAKDIATLIHKRRGSIAKSISSFTSAEKARVRIYGERSPGRAGTQLLTVLTMLGVRNLLTHKSKHPCRDKVLQWSTMTAKNICTFYSNGTQYPTHIDRDAVLPKKYHVSNGHIEEEEIDLDMIEEGDESECDSDDEEEEQNEQQLHKQWKVDEVAAPASFTESYGAHHTSTLNCPKHPLSPTDQKSTAAAPSIKSTQHSSNTKNEANSSSNRRVRIDMRRIQPQAPEHQRLPSIDKRMIRAISAPPISRKNTEKGHMKRQSSEQHLDSMIAMEDDDKQESDNEEDAEQHYEVASSAMSHDATDAAHVAYQEKEQDCESDADDHDDHNDSDMDIAEDDDDNDESTSVRKDSHEPVSSSVTRIPITLHTRQSSTLTNSFWLNTTASALGQTDMVLVSPAQMTRQLHVRTTLCGTPRSAGIAPHSASAPNTPVSARLISPSYHAFINNNTSSVTLNASPSAFVLPHHHPSASLFSFAAATMPLLSPLPPLSPMQYMLTQTNSNMQSSTAYNINQTTSNYNQQTSSSTSNNPANS